jgi:uncharacterized protein YhaN
MRIARLHLMAYGPFRGLEIDLSAPGLHVVFGRNEAGKSTTLRAITGLLYGIDARTPDAHVHKPAELRIGGTLVSDDGARIDVVRRKGVSKGGPNTLLDVGGQAIDEAVLQRLLRGVTEDTFKNAFGLDLERLHLGARALLEGGGDVGGSLFDASVGGGGDTRGLLAHLNDEADKLYKPRATAPALNAALKAFAEAQKAIKERQSLPEAYTLQRDALEQAHARHDEQVEKRAGLAARRALVERARRRVPLEKKRANLVALLAPLGELARHAARITSLHSRLGAYERATTTHREEGAEAQRLRDRVADAARRAGVPSGATELRLDGRTESRIQRLLRERTAASERAEKARVEIARDQRELGRLRAAAVAPRALETAATAALVRAAERARGLGDTLTRHASDRQKAERRRGDVTAKAAALGSFEGTLEELVALRLPAAGTLDALAARASELDRTLSRHTERVAGLDAQALAVDQQLAEASGDFAPPAKADLEASRLARDEAWTRVREARGAGLDERALAALDSAFERAARDADVLADRMIIEADRVTTLARLRAQQSTLAQQRRNALAEREKAEAERAALDHEHDEVWSTAGITARGLAEMRAWLQKHASITESFAAVREAELDVEDTANKLAAATSELAAALDASGEGASLVELLDRASAQLERSETARRDADEAARAVARLETQIGEREATLASDEVALADVRVRLAELVSPLGVPEDASAEEVTRALEALRELFTLEDQRASAEARAALAAAEALAFDEESARAAVDLASDLVGLPARDVVAELAVRANRALAAEAQLAEANAELTELGDEAVSEEISLLVADSEAASRALEEIDAQLTDVDREITKETRLIGGIENGLAQMRVESGAAEASAQAQEALERVRSSVERYVRAKVGAVILAREIERYREENQGPTLTKASALFARLTLGSFAGARAGYDDKDRPAIRCVRDGSAEVDVAGLSEGTRDQLYLSLRLASLFRYADLAEPMPLVLDDVLVQFDDERSRAALEILAELSTRMQVLFFTHHARLVELARAAVPACSLTVHELSSPQAAFAGVAAPA